MDVPTVFDRILDRHQNDGSDEVLGQRGRRYLLLIGIGLLVGGPFIQVVQSFWLNILTEILILALFAISLDFAFGYSNLPSFGHAAMFGVGGYTVALVGEHVTQNLLVVVPIAVLSSSIVAVVIGWLSVRSRGIFFAFLTLAFAQVLYIAAFTDLPADLLGIEQVTNGDDGLIGVPSFELFGIDLGGQMMYYYLCLIALILTTVLIIRLAHSPFGRVLQGIRENEERIGMLGYNTTVYKVLVFTLSGGLTGLAGALYVPMVTVAHPNQLHWTMSGDLIIMVLIGGMATLWGPMFGAALVVLFEEMFSAFGNWHLYLGLLYVLIVIFLPTGIAGLFESPPSDLRDVWDSTRAAGRRYVRAVTGG